MIEIVLVSLTLMLISLAFIYSSIVRIERFVKILKINLRKFRKNRKKALTTSKKISSSLLLEWIFYIGSFTKFKVYIFFFSLSSFVLITKINLPAESVAVTLITGFLVVIILIGISEFISYSYQDFQIDCLSYFIKFCIVIIYVTSLLNGYLSNLNNFPLLIVTIMISIVYTFSFLKNIIDSFRSFTFHFLNFIMLLIVMNFLVIGVAFGFYYLNKYDNYNYFTLEQYQSIYYSQDLRSLYHVIYKGLTPFFNFPDEIIQSDDLYQYIPFLQFILGYIFNLSFVGFFISYSAGKLLARASLSKREKLSP